MTSFLDNPKRYDHPGKPLPPFAWLLVAAVCLVGVAVVAAGAKLERILFARYNGDRVEQVVAAPGTEEAVTVIALGDSQLRYGTLDPPEMRALAAERGYDLRFARIAHNGGTFADLSGVLDKVIELRPDLVLVQVNLLFAETSRLREHVDFFRGAVSRFARLQTPFENQEWLQSDRKCEKEDARWRWDDESLATFTGEFDKYVWTSQDAVSFDIFRSFAERLEAEGIKLVLLQMRSLPMLETHYYGPGRFYHDWAWDRVGQVGSWPVWYQPPHLITTDLYCDFAHLDPVGRRIFSTWLVDQIAAEAIR